MRWEAAQLAAAALLAAIPANAMQFHAVSLPGAQYSVAIEAEGPIIPGDFDRLMTLARSLPATNKVVGFLLDSPGGNLLEAEKLAQLMQAISATTAVLSGDKCASACFLIFAAGAKKFVAADALIGVHSAASEEGQETAESMAMTTAMARDAGNLGVPAAIVGKMIETQPGRMEWLTPRDLHSMGVTIMQPPPPAASAEAPSSATPPQGSANATVRGPSAPLESLAFQRGVTDRRSWEQWFAGLAGDYRDGAEFWATHRSDPGQGSCYGPQGQTLGDWTAGCLTAQQRLAPSDVRRKTEVDYYRGWNSY